MKTIAGVLFLILLFPLSSSALPIIQDDGPDSFTIGDNVGQTFTLTDRTDVASVGAFIFAANDVPGVVSFTMSLFEGDGIFSGELKSEKIFTVPENFEGYADMDVSSESFVTGIYTLALFDDTFKWGVQSNNTENPYDGGKVYLGSSLDLPDADLRFRVKPIPEPATILLLGAGLVGLAGLGRKKFRKK